MSKRPDDAVPEEICEDDAVPEEIIEPTPMPPADAYEDTDPDCRPVDRTQPLWIKQ